MMRGKLANFRIFIFLLAIFCAFHLSNSAKCERTPVASSAAKSPSDGRFRLSIKSDPDRYVPLEPYTISIEAVQRPNQQNTFTGFFLVVDKEMSTDESRTSLSNGNNEVGLFEITDPAIARISEKCNNLVQHATSNAERNVSVIWKAPEANSGCVIFKATVIERRDVWFADDGPLTAVLCEDVADSGDVQPIVQPVCNACSEAKYEMTLQRMWSKNTHPKGYPIGWNTGFSDVIGASHSNEMNVWKIGEIGREGIHMLATRGNTDYLEAELKNNKTEIRTIIKARGIDHGDTNGKTYAVFRVDPQHHIISLASQIIPSPDWFIGISGLELCSSNGEWTKQREMNLYPFDAGADSGATYTSHDQETKPKEAIRRIKPYSPNDPNSPFQDDEVKSMKPMAKLVITLQRTYELNNCGNSQENENSNENEDETKPDDVHEPVQNQRPYGGNSNSNIDIQNACKTTPWSSWSECDSECKRIRTRQYETQYGTSYQEKNCRLLLSETKDCDDSCKIRDITETDLENSETKLEKSDCKVEKDGPIGECVKKCGPSKKYQKFKFVDEKTRELCEKLFPELIEKKGFVCHDNPECQGEIGGSKQNPNNCQIEYSHYSYCNPENCGKKFKVLTKFKNSKFDNIIDQKLKAELKDFKKKIDKSFKSSTELTEADFGDIDGSIAFDEDKLDVEHPCFGQELLVVEHCSDDEQYECKYFCSEQPIFEAPEESCQGQERNATNKWYYNHKTEECGLFTYNDCKYPIEIRSDEVKNNNFETDEDCMSTCGPPPEKSSREVEESAQSHLAMMSLRLGPQNCIVSNWMLHPCMAPCNRRGIKWKYRTVIQPARNGGRACPPLTSTPTECFNYCNDNINDSEETESMQKMKTSTQKSIYSTKRKQHQFTTTTTTSKYNTIPFNSQTSHCRYSDWSAWSPCSQTCGDYSVQIRTRNVISRYNSHLCTERIEDRLCNVLPCNFSRSNNRQRY